MTSETLLSDSAVKSQPAERGPAGTALFGTGAVVVWNDVAPEGRERFYEWHDKEHIPERLAIPGFRRGRRYISAGHSPEWLTLYEADDIDVVTSREYLARLNSPTPQTVQTLRYFRNTSRAVCRLVHSVGSSSGGHVLAMRVDVPPGQGDMLSRCLSMDVFPRSMALTGIVACHLYAADEAASFTNTAESKTREFDVPNWVVLVEATRPQAAQHVRALVEAPDLHGAGVVVRGDAAVYSLEICRLSPPANAS